MRLETEELKRFIDFFHEFLAPSDALLTRLTRSQYRKGISPHLTTTIRPEKSITAERMVKLWVRTRESNLGYVGALNPRHLTIHLGMLLTFASCFLRTWWETSVSL